MFSCMSLLLTSCEDKTKELSDISLVPVYSLTNISVNAIDNTATGYTSISLPFSVDIYHSRNLVIEFDNEDTSPSLNIDTRTGNVQRVEVSNNSVAFIPNETDSTLPGTPGSYVVSYTTNNESDSDEEDEMGNVVKTVNTKETTIYSIDLENTDNLGEVIAPLSGSGLEISHTEIVTTIEDKSETDVEGTVTTTTDATNDVGGITTVIKVENDTKTTVTTTVSSAVCNVTIQETEKYN